MSFGATTADYGLGNNGVKVSLNYFDGIIDQSLIAALGSVELQLVFKLLLKRDETTKDKALSELLQLMNRDESIIRDDCFALCWSQLYAKLISNESKSIRITAHTVTTRLIKILGKKGAKFLPDFIPLLLSGCYDYDPSVGRACLLSLRECFGNDDGKVNALWKLFKSQILNFVREITIIENEASLSDERFVSKQECELRYTRVVTSAICVLNRLCKENEKEALIKDPVFINIVANAELWRLLSFKGIGHLKTSEALLSLVSTLWEQQFLGSSKDVLKIVGKRVLKATSQISSKNALSISPIFPDLLAVVTLLANYKDGKVFGWDKSSLDKIRNFLLLGPGNAGPVYYSRLFSFYNTTKTCLALDFKADWLAIWRKDLAYENNRRGLPSRTQASLEQFWMSYSKFIADAPEEYIQESTTWITEDIIDFLDLKDLPKEGKLTQLLSETVSFEILKAEIIAVLPGGTSIKHENTCFAENLTRIALTKSENEAFMKDLADTVLESMKTNQQEIKHYGLNFFDKIIKLKESCLEDKVISFFNLLTLHINAEAYEDPSRIMIDFSRSTGSGSFSQKGMENALCAFTEKLLSLEISQNQKLEFLSKIDRPLFERLAHQSLVVNNFLNDTKENFDFANPTLYEGPLLSEENVLDFYALAGQQSHLSQFCSHCAALRPSLFEILLLKSDLLIDMLFEEHGDITLQLRNKVLELAGSNGTVVEKAALAIIKHVKATEHLEADVMAYVENLLKANDSIIDKLIPADIDSEINQSIPFVGYQLSLSSSLGLNIHLMNASSEVLDFGLCRPTIRYGKFLDCILQKNARYVNERVLLFLSFVSELACDYNFFSSEPSDDYQDVENVIFKYREYDISFETLIETIVCSQETHNSLLKRLTKTDGLTDVSIVYNCRILKRILRNAVETISSPPKSELEAINNYVTEKVRGKGISQSELLLVSVILSELANYSVNTDFLTRSKTLLASEMIGVKGSELVEKTTRIILLLNNMLVVEDSGSIANDSLPIAPQRLKMILNDIWKWLDSDICYESSFSLVRLCLLRFLGLILKFPSSASLGQSLFDICVRVVTDSFEVLHMEDTPFCCELELQAVDFFKQLSIFAQHEIIDPTVWQSDRSSIVELMVDIFLLKPDIKDANHLSFVFYRSLSQVFYNVPVESFRSYSKQLLENILLSSRSNIDQTRLIVMILRRSILASQQEVLIDFELKNTSLSEDEEPEEYHLLPEDLLSRIENNMPQEYLEYENENHFLSFLWCCYLALSYFQDVSYNMRQSLVNQLRNRGLITKLYDFIADQLDLEDKSWMPTDTSTIEHYNIEGPDISSTKKSILQECRMLMLHLLYTLFKNVGSLTSSWWLNIKDRSLQMKVEKFVTTHISKILIDQELREIGEKVKKLTAQDSSLTIKLNNVTNEIKAGYLVDEQRLEISLKLPLNYPLNNIQVHGVSRVGINEQKWKSWILSAQRVIVGMNGSVMDSLELFTKNVNLHFSGFEECAICYSILHAVDRKLPSKVCPTCNNRFHGACLYKWFRSSGNNTCPLCRSEIPFRR